MSDVTANKGKTCGTERKSTASDESAPTELPAKVLSALDTIVRGGPILEYELDSHAISGVGENSYGIVLEVRATPTRTLPTFARVLPIHVVVKMAPTHAARRAHMKVADFYAREAFMYKHVLHAYQELEAKRTATSEQLQVLFDVIPQMRYASLEPCEEFIIFEDLCKSGYMQNARTQMPSYDLVASALRALAQLHAMSFVLQAKQPQQFGTLITQLTDNLFTEQIDPVSIEFGKKYLRRARLLLQSKSTQNCHRSVQLLEQVEKQYKEICLRCVNGATSAPYAVICHGDFWNNNILYKYNEKQQATSAKLIDFQMSRYASPVLDIVQYFFTCTTKSLRDAHFCQLLQLYYDTLAQLITVYGLQSDAVYPQSVFQQQLREFGVFGICMAAMAVPFYISQGTEIPDLDEVAQAIHNLSTAPALITAATGTTDSTEAEESRAADKYRELVDEYDLITPRNITIFKDRMSGIVEDMIKYDMAGKY